MADAGPPGPLGAIVTDVDASCGDEPPAVDGVSCSPETNLAAICGQYADGHTIIDVISGWEPSSSNVPTSTRWVGNDCTVDAPENIVLGQVCADDARRTTVHRCRSAAPMVSTLDVPWSSSRLRMAVRPSGTLCHQAYPMGARLGVGWLPSRACIDAVGCGPAVLRLTVSGQVTPPMAWECRVAWDGSRLSVTAGGSVGPQGGTSTIPCMLPPLDPGSYEVPFTETKSLHFTVVEDGRVIGECVDLR